MKRWAPQPTRRRPQGRRKTTASERRRRRLTGQTLKRWAEDNRRLVLTGSLRGIRRNMTQALKGTRSGGGNRTRGPRSTPKASGILLTLAEALGLRRPSRGARDSLEP